jgi:hypothetical protein
VIEPHQQRISDDDRDRTAEFLREAAGEGRIDLEELDERLEAAYAAKVYADLVPLVVDLPGAEPALPPGMVPAPRPGSVAVPAGAPEYGTSLAVMSGQDRKGVWLVPASHTAFTLMGGVGIDLREAVFTTPEVVINANAIMGAVDITVNAGTRVTVEGVGIMGTFEEGRAKVEPEIGPGSPHVRVRGIALMGAVSVVRKPMPGEKRKRLRRASD